MKRTNKTLVIVIAIVTALIGTLVVLSVTAKDNDDNVTTTPQSSIVQTEQPLALETTDQPQTTGELLLYLIEEEKLAHDVYTVMYEKYGANVFGNILESETTHQARVLTLLDARNIADPRSPEIGVFRDQDLQAFYDALIIQGNQNVTEAYKVGIAIEEKDIYDISVQLATATDRDVIAALEALRSGSENHLRAFNRKL